MLKVKKRNVTLSNKLYQRNKESGRNMLLSKTKIKLATIMKLRGKFYIETEKTDRQTDKNGRSKF